MRPTGCATLLAISLATAGAASAAVTEPNGQQVPVDSVNGEVQLYTYFAALNDPINYQADAVVPPPAIVPTAEFRVTFGLHQASTFLGLAWYNHGAVAPGPADLHVLIPAGSPVGTEAMVDLAADPNYLGGGIGLALTGGQTHYMDAAHGPQCSGCDVPAPWIMAVWYESSLDPGLAYLAFEDGAAGASPAQFNNDGDFNDAVYLIEGFGLCGNGEVSGDEACDDGNLVDGDGCDSTCTVTACGNEVVTGDETCDDGNLDDDDGCDSNCTATGCGNGVVTGDEACDDGNVDDDDGCDSNCTATGCGNGVVTGAEACDDGNVDDDDGCDSNCTTTGCGNGVVAGDEACDDGNLDDGDGCDSNCTTTGCGNGVVTGAEVCDDGNLEDGDGCEAGCTPAGIGPGPEAGGCCGVGGDAPTSLFMVALLGGFATRRRRRRAAAARPGRS